MTRLTQLDYQGLYVSMTAIVIRGTTLWAELFKGEITAVFLPVAVLCFQWGLLGVFVFINQNFGPDNEPNQEYWVYQWGMGLTFVLILCTSSLFVVMGYDRWEVGIDLISIPILAAVWLWAEFIYNDETRERSA